MLVELQLSQLDTIDGHLLSIDDTGICTVLGEDGELYKGYEEHLTYLEEV